jgi:hypothetical protein
MKKKFEDRFNRFGYSLGDPLLSGVNGGLVTSSGDANYNAQINFSLAE